jgi:hypothetical protein
MPPSADNPAELPQPPGGLGQLRNQGKFHGVVELRLHHGVKLEVFR